MAASLLFASSSSSLLLWRPAISHNRVISASFSNLNPNPTTASRLRRWPSFSRAAASPPPPPETSPPNESGEGLQVTLSKIQDRIRIFFAVFFWMSLFFWGSAWDKGDDSMKNKNPWFRK